MSKFSIMLVAGTTAAFIAGASIGLAQANERYQIKPSVGVSADLSAPWVMQLQANPTALQRQRAGDTQRSANVQQRSGTAFSRNTQAIQRPVQVQRVEQVQVQQVQVRAPVAVQRPQAVQQVSVPAKRSQKAAVGSEFLPQVVNYQSSGRVGDIVINTKTRHLYLNLGNGQAKRYGVGVGKQGFEWSGSEKITRKAEWPGWTPPKSMIERERKKGRHLPAHMKGGPENPLGARALYLGSTLYRIHGTNQPWTIGQAMSSGCIRMRNEDVTDLYERVRVGAKVTVM